MNIPPESTHQVPPPPGGATTLRTIVELVRSIMGADVASIFGFSLTDKTVTWKAAAGFRSPDIDFQQAVRRPLAVDLALRALAENRVIVFEGTRLGADLSAGNFPVYIAEGVDHLAVAPLCIAGDRSGAVAAGFRTPHQFNEAEKRLLQDLAEMASLTLDNARLLEVASENEARAQQSQRMWEETFDAIGEGILVYDQEQKIVRCNAKAAEMLGMSPASVAGVSFPAAFARVFGQPAADHYLAEGDDFSTVAEIRAEENRRFLISSFPIHQPDGRPFNVVTWNDVTRMSEMQEQLARSHRLAALGQLAAGVAHEVNNPLAVITTCAETMIRNIRRRENNESAANVNWDYYLEEILRQSQRCEEMTRGLLDLTRQRQAKSSLCDVNALTADCVRVARLREGVHAEFEVEPDERVGRVPTDAGMVRQILNNLLSNALDALGEKQQGRITVSTKGEVDRVIIEVADTGSGVQPDLLPKIFDPFFSTKRGKGYGLGLSICLTLAESLGGGIMLETKAGEGSRFRLWLPRRAAEQA